MKKKNLLILFLGLAVVCIAGCKTYSDGDLKTFDEQIQSYITKEKLDSLERSESGMYYRILSEGDGDPILYTDLVSFKYTGSLLDGTVFDRQTEPISFQVNELIGAWREIMSYLKPGGKAFLIAPPQLGYGDQNLDDIPANSILIFEIEVVEVK